MSFLAFGAEEAAVGAEELGAGVASTLEHNSGMIEAEGFEGAIGWLASIAHRIEAPEAILATAFDSLEQSERELFASLGGRFVRSGATEDSLTQRDDPEAVREVSATELVFGSAVPYAVFQTRVIEGGRHYGGSAILVDADSVLGIDEDLLTGFTGESE